MLFLTLSLSSSSSTSLPLHLIVFKEECWLFPQSCLHLSSNKDTFQEHVLMTLIIDVQVIYTGEPDLNPFQP